jgi:hypothetical protein
MAAFAAIIDHRKKRNIALGWPFAAVVSTIQATKAHQPDLTTDKLLINSTISTPGAKFLGINLANFYLNTPMPNPEYMRLHLNIIPNKNHCPLQPLRHCHSWWMGIHQDSKGDVWSLPSRHSCKSTTWKMPHH